MSPKLTEFPPVERVTYSIIFWFVEPVADLPPITTPRVAFELAELIPLFVDKSPKSCASTPVVEIFTNWITLVNEGHAPPPNATALVGDAHAVRYAPENNVFPSKSFASTPSDAIVMYCIKFVNGLGPPAKNIPRAVSYTHLRAHET